MANKSGDLLVADMKDFEFDGKDFMICGYCYKDKNGNIRAGYCSCKDWSKCKGFREGKNAR